MSLRAVRVGRDLGEIRRQPEQQVGRGVACERGLEDNSRIGLEVLLQAQHVASHIAPMRRKCAPRVQFSDSEN